MVRHDLGIFDPQYTFDKHGIDRDHPDAVNLLIKDIRYLMEYAGGIIGSYNTSFAEKSTVEKWIWDNIPNGLSYKPIDFSKKKQANTDAKK